MPEWAQRAFEAAMMKVELLEVKTLEEVFGRPLAKGKQLANERIRLHALSKVFFLVHDHRQAGEGIGKELFAAVGKEVGVSATVAEELYYEACRLDRDGD